MHCCHSFLKEKKNLYETAWAPSVFGAVWFCRWVVTHSLRRFQLLWPRSWCLHHTEHPFAFIGRLEQICLGPAYLENVRLNPSSPELLTSYGPLRIFDTRNYIFFLNKFKKKATFFKNTFINKYIFIVVLSKVRCSHRFKVWEKAEVVKIRPTDTSSHCFTLFWYVFCVCVTLCLDSSYPEGNFGENQLLDGSISLSPLYSVQEVTICTSVPHNASFHQVFTWLHHVRE